MQAVVAIRRRDRHAGLVSEVETFTAAEFGALTGDDLWGVGDQVWGEPAEGLAVRSAPSAASYVSGGFVLEEAKVRTHPQGDAEAENIGDDVGMGNPSRVVVLVLSVLALAASAKPEEPQRAKLEMFTPGKARHGGEVDAVTRKAAQVVATMWEMQPTVAPGLVTTEWTYYNRTEYPRMLVRFVITVSETEVVVDIQCRAFGDSCTGILPDGEKNSVTVKKMADDIVADYPAEDTRMPEPERVRACFSSGGAEQCFDTNEECDREREAHEGATPCAAR
jgi:hypothetical protein